MFVIYDKTKKDEILVPKLDQHQNHQGIFSDILSLKKENLELHRSIHQLEQRMYARQKHQEVAMTSATPSPTRTVSSTTQTNEPSTPYHSKIFEDKVLGLATRMKTVELGLSQAQQSIDKTNASLFKHFKVDSYNKTMEERMSELQLTIESTNLGKNCPVFSSQIQKHFFSYFSSHNLW